MAQLGTGTGPSSTPATADSDRGWLRRNWWVIGGLLIAAVVVILLAPAASENPDGLDRVSEDREFAETAEEPRYEFLPDYTIPGIDNEWASVVLAGIIGVGIVFVVLVLLGWLLSQSRKGQARKAAGP